MLAKLVIHAVGPVWQDGQSGEKRQLASAVFSAIKMAHEKGFASIALPAISSGIFGFPKRVCAQVMFRCAEHFALHYADSPLRIIRFTNIDTTTVNVFVEEFDKQFGTLAPVGSNDNEEADEDEDDSLINAADESSASGSSDSERQILPDEVSSVGDEQDDEL